MITQSFKQEARLLQTLGLYLIAFLLTLVTITVAHAEEKRGKQEPAPTDFFKGEPDTPYPDTTPLLVNAFGRDYQSLNGLWDIIIDEAGMAWRVITKHDYFSGATGVEDFEHRLLEHSFDASNQLRVPGDWNSQRPELDRYRSRILYHKSVELEPKVGQRYFLHFGGANYTTDLFVNDRLVGRHHGGYTSFNFDVTDFLVSGPNSIIVRVDAALDETTIPTMRTSDFWKYGGLIGDVGLITLPETYISQYHIFLANKESGAIEGWVQLAGSAAAQRKVTLKIGEAGIKVSATTDTSGRAKFSLMAKNLKLWSPETPTLYDVTLAQSGEQVADKIGFRTIATDGLKILLNGKPLRLRGISLHEETTLHAGIATTREDVLANFKLVQELGANYVRLAHYPHNEHTLKLADELGLLVWSEVPIVSLIDWENPKTLAQAKAQLTENVTRDMNRASIIMWSIANESFPQSEARLNFLTQLANLARSLDVSRRPIASALVGGQGEEFKGLAKQLFSEVLHSPNLAAADRQRLMAMATKMGGGESSQAAVSQSEELLTIVVGDPLGGVVDIAGYNEYFGWYYSKYMAQLLGLDEMLVRDAMFKVMPKVRISNPYGKPMIISEFGAGAKYGLHSENALLWSEEYQAKVYRAQLDMLAKSEFVQGYSPWVLKDFRSHLRELNGIQDTYNRKGLVSETGEKKLAFEVLKQHYLAESNQ
ncbi:glycoside hydrolase family 2 protein [Halioxenophilus sp. WMMB6]|uniref:glycoside hydrolase family 2 protein n=1 Tax=Halioxenophilus sp. WMMB6 TaxID=3073815 RepID=UPI00295ED24C|nr:glycoside hydrolase family 2 TIM barrel-domain containing protein [Halioxenophilus sp. WMMB6]